MEAEVEVAGYGLRVTSSVSATTRNSQPVTRNPQLVTRNLYRPPPISKIVPVT